MPHSAVLLAGGKSSRMGRDKAALTVGSVELWKRQLGILRETSPAELFISCGQVTLNHLAAGSNPPGSMPVETLADDFPDSGPLGGISTALRRCTSPFLLVMAVDMPAMTPKFLQDLTESAHHQGCGVIPQDGNGYWESLAAVYPKSAQPIAEELLASGVRKMERFICALLDARLAVSRPLSEGEMALFENWNEPGDIRDL